jgi:hypothetical protein
MALGFAFPLLRNNSMKTYLMILLLIVAALFAAAPNASAQGYCGNNGGGWGWGGYDMGYMYGQMAYNVPHFAAFPPVYYSYPVPRTYGYSPFAYPPGTMTPEVVMDDAAQPVEIINPYVPSKETSTTSADQSAAVAPKNTQPQPLVIINPYVAGAKSIAQAAN